MQEYPYEGLAGILIFVGGIFIIFGIGYVFFSLVDSD